MSFGNESGMEAMQPPIHQPIVVHQSKLKLCLLLVLSSLIALLGFAILMVDPSDFVIGLIIFIFFGAGVIIFLAQLSTTPVILTIDEDGFRTRKPPLRNKVEDVRWDEIACLRGRKIRRTTVGIVYVTEEGRRSFFPRNGKQAPNHNLAFLTGATDAETEATDFYCGITDLSYRQVIEKIRAQYPDKLEQYHIVLHGDEER